MWRTLLIDLIVRHLAQSCLSSACVLGGRKARRGETRGAGASAMALSEKEISVDESIIINFERIRPNLAAS